MEFFEAAVAVECSRPSDAVAGGHDLITICFLVGPLDSSSSIAKSACFISAVSPQKSQVTSLHN